MHPFAVEIPRHGAGPREVSNLLTALRVVFVHPAEGGGCCGWAVQQDEMWGQQSLQSSVLIWGR